MVIQFNPRTGSRGIEWTDRTWNRTGGCLHGCVWHMPDGTRAECYASQLAEHGVAKPAYPQGFDHHYWRDGSAGELRGLKTPSMVFVDSMSDLFGHWVPEVHVTEVLGEIEKSPQHIAQVLTKNAPGILKYADRLPTNLWVGVSSPPDEMWGKQLSRNQQARMLARQLSVLGELTARRPELLMWMSIEPLSWDISELLAEFPVLRWAVIGAATSGRKKFQPDSRHVRNVLEVLDAQGVPVFFKGNLQWPEWREDFPALDHAALARRQKLAAKHGWTLSKYVVEV